jgi:amidohydrolase
VKLCFQPGEEGSDGGGAMVKAGVLESPKVDFAFALHVWNPMEAGKFSASAGPRMAAVDEFAVDIIGVGGHAAHPQDCADPIVAAAAVVGNLHTVVSRNIDPFRPAVLTVASINAGTAFNIIPPKVTMKGTIRTFHKDVRKTMEKRFRECVTKTAAALGCKAEIEFKHMLDATLNDAAHAPFVQAVGAEVYGKKNVIDFDPSMGGEDFSRYAERVPSVFAFAGAAFKDASQVFPHHHPKFSIDESVLPACVEVMKRVALAYLEKK